MVFPNPSTFGLPSASFTLGLGLHRMIHKIIKPVGLNEWKFAVTDLFPYCENDFLMMFKGKSLRQNPQNGRFIIDGDPNKYYEHLKGGLHLVTPTQQVWYRPANPGELTSVFPYFVELPNGYFENHSFFMYQDHRDNPAIEMTAYGLQYHILQDANGNGIYEQYNSIEVYRHNNVWNDPLNLRLGITVQSVNPSTLLNGKPKWNGNTVKIRNDNTAKLRMSILTGHDLFVWQYETIIQ